QRAREERQNGAKPFDRASVVQSIRRSCWPLNVATFGLLEEPMDKPRIFLGSSGKQEKLLQALTRGLSDIAHVEPWTTSFNPGTSTLERLLELTQEVDFATFAFA